MRSARVVSSVTMTRLSRSRETPRGSVPSSMPPPARRARAGRSQTAAATAAAMASAAAHSQRERLIPEARG